MKIKKKGIPEEGDIVLVTVTRIEPHAAFIRLDEYENVNGLIHISEISKSWVKNIKSHLRVNQQVVCKVIRVKEEENFVECSIRRVSDYDRRAKWDQIRRQKRAEAIISLISERLKMSFSKVYELLKPLEEKYGELYIAFEEAKKEGKSFFSGILPKKVAEVTWEIVDKSISLPKVSVKGIIVLKSYASDGIERIKKILSNLDAEVKYLSASKYLIKVEDIDYKKAEKKLKGIISKIEGSISPLEVFRFKREKK